MNRIVLGALVALALAGLGTFWWEGRAQVERAAPPPEQLATTEVLPELPPSEPGDMVGPAPPEASELTREQRRFFRYDRNRDWRITRTEMLSSRTDAFRKLDNLCRNINCDCIFFRHLTSSLKIPTWYPWRLTGHI